MNKFTLKTALALGIVVIGALGSSLVQAHPGVRWSVSIGVPLQPIYSPRFPGYYEPAPVYYEPAPVVVQPYPYFYDRPVQYRDPTRWDRDGDGISYRYEYREQRPWDRDRDRDRDWNRDRDRDGVPDRYDRRPRDSWRH